MASERGAHIIRRRFDRLSAGYDRNPVTRWVGRSELRALRALIPAALHPGQTPALDFGCGTGRATRLLLELGYRVTGYDLSDKMLARARAAPGEHPGVTFTNVLPWRDLGWPLLVALGVLDYYPRAAPLWAAWRQLLAPDGLLVVTAPNAASPLAWVYAALSRLTCPAHPARVAQLAEAARESGFSLRAVRYAFPGHARLGHTLVLKLEIGRA